MKLVIYLTLIVAVWSVLCSCYEEIPDLSLEGYEGSLQCSPGDIACGQYVEVDFEEGSTPSMQTLNLLPETCTDLVDDVLEVCQIGSETYEDSFKQFLSLEFPDAYIWSFLTGNPSVARLDVGASCLLTELKFLTLKKLALPHQDNGKVRTKSVMYRLSVPLFKTETSVKIRESDSNFPPLNKNLKVTVEHNYMNKRVAEYNLVSYDYNENGFKVNVMDYAIQNRLTVLKNLHSITNESLNYILNHSLESSLMNSSSFTAVIDTLRNSTLVSIEQDVSFKNDLFDHNLTQVFHLGDSNWEQVMFLGKYFKLAVEGKWHPDILPSYEKTATFVYSGQIHTLKIEVKEGTFFKVTYSIPEEFHTYALDIEIISHTYEIVGKVIYTNGLSGRPIQKIGEFSFTTDSKLAVLKWEAGKHLTCIAMKLYQKLLSIYEDKEYYKNVVEKYLDEYLLHKTKELLDCFTISLKCLKNSLLQYYEKVAKYSVAVTESSLDSSHTPKRTLEFDVETLMDSMWSIATDLVRNVNLAPFVAFFHHY